MTALLQVTPLTPCDQMYNFQTSSTVEKISQTSRNVEQLINNLTKSKVSFFLFYDGLIHHKVNFGRTIDDFLFILLSAALHCTALPNGV